MVNFGRTVATELTNQISSCLLQSLEDNVVNYNEQEWRPGPIFCLKLSHTLCWTGQMQLPTMLSAQSHLDLCLLTPNSLGLFWRWCSNWHFAS